METKICSKCNIEKPLSEFQFRKDTGKRERIIKTNTIKNIKKIIKNIENREKNILKNILKKIMKANVKKK